MWHGQTQLSCQLAYGTRSTAAIMASLFTVVRIVRGLPAFTYALGVTGMLHGDAAPIIETC
jgi:hypothetical protein